MGRGAAGVRGIEVEEGDQVIVGPFSSVRELRDGAVVKATPATRTAGTTTTGR